MRARGVGPFRTLHCEARSKAILSHQPRRPDSVVSSSDDHRASRRSQRVTMPSLAEQPGWPGDIQVPAECRTLTFHGHTGEHDGDRSVADCSEPRRCTTCQLVSRRATSSGTEVDCRRRVPHPHAEGHDRPRAAGGRRFCGAVRSGCRPVRPVLTSGDHSREEHDVRFALADRGEDGTAVRRPRQASRDEGGATSKIGELAKRPVDGRHGPDIGGSVVDQRQREPLPVR